ncbi:unnamed protein product [Amoebophrya sp. A25]|nr:unnamed protein product [Amoebophrya sp. A25]|eukprot:GSA25T00008987001.1
MGALHGEDEPQKIGVRAPTYKTPSSSFDRLTSSVLTNTTSSPSKIGGIITRAGGAQGIQQVDQHRRRTAIGGGPLSPVSGVAPLPDYVKDRCSRQTVSQRLDLLRHAANDATSSPSRFDRPGGRSGPSSPSQKILRSGFQHDEKHFEVQSALSTSPPGGRPLKMSDAERAEMTSPSRLRASQKIRTSLSKVILPEQRGAGLAGTTAMRSRSSPPKDQSRSVPGLSDFLSSTAVSFASGAAAATFLDGNRSKGTLDDPSMDRTFAVIGGGASTFLGGGSRGGSSPPTTKSLLSPTSKLGLMVGEDFTSRSRHNRKENLPSRFLFPGLERESDRLREASMSQVIAGGGGASSSGSQAGVSAFSYLSGTTTTQQQLHELPTSGAATTTSATSGPALGASSRTPVAVSGGTTGSFSHGRIRGGPFSRWREAKLEAEYDSLMKSLVPVRDVIWNTASPKSASGGALTALPLGGPSSSSTAVGLSSSSTSCTGRSGFVPQVQVGGVPQAGTACITAGAAAVRSAGGGGPDVLSASHAARDQNQVSDSFWSRRLPYWERLAKQSEKSSTTLVGLRSQMMDDLTATGLDRINLAEDKSSIDLLEERLLRLRRPSLFGDLPAEPIAVSSHARALSVPPPLDAFSAKGELTSSPSSKFLDPRSASAERPAYSLGAVGHHQPSPSTRSPYNTMSGSGTGGGRGLQQQSSLSQFELPLVEQKRQKKMQQREAELLRYERHKAAARELAEVNKLLKSCKNRFFTAEEVLDYLEERTSVPPAMITPTADQLDNLTVTTPNYDTPTTSTGRPPGGQRRDTSQSGGGLVRQSQFPRGQGTTSSAAAPLGRGNNKACNVVINPHHGPKRSRQQEIEDRLRSRSAGPPGVVQGSSSCVVPSQGRHGRPLPTPLSSTIEDGGPRSRSEERNRLGGGVADVARRRFQPSPGLQRDALSATVDGQIRSAAASVEEAAPLKGSRSHEHLLYREAVGQRKHHYIPQATTIASRGKRRDGQDHGDVLSSSIGSSVGGKGPPGQHVVVGEGIIYRGSRRSASASTTKKVKSSGSGGYYPTAGGGSKARRGMLASSPGAGKDGADRSSYHQSVGYNPDRRIYTRTTRAGSKDAPPPTSVGARAAYLSALSVADEVERVGEQGPPGVVRHPPLEADHYEPPSEILPVAPGASDEPIYLTLEPTSRNNASSGRQKNDQAKQKGRSNSAHGGRSQRRGSAPAALASPGVMEDRRNEVEPDYDEFSAWYVKPEKTTAPSGGRSGKGKAGGAKKKNKKVEQASRADVGMSSSRTTRPAGPRDQEKERQRRREPASNNEFEFAEMQVVEDKSRGSKKHASSSTQAGLSSSSANVEFQQHSGTIDNRGTTQPFAVIDMSSGASRNGNGANANELVAGSGGTINGLFGDPVYELKQKMASPKCLSVQGTTTRTRGSPPAFQKSYLYRTLEARNEYAKQVAGRPLYAVVNNVATSSGRAATNMMKTRGGGTSNMVTHDTRSSVSTNYTTGGQVQSGGGGGNSSFVHPVERDVAQEDQNQRASTSSSSAFSRYFAMKHREQSLSPQKPQHAQPSGGKGVGAKNKDRIAHGAPQQNNYQLFYSNEQAVQDQGHQCGKLAEPADSPNLSEIELLHSEAKAHVVTKNSHSANKNAAAVPRLGLPGSQIGPTDDIFRQRGLATIAEQQQNSHSQQNSQQTQQGQGPFVHMQDGDHLLALSPLAEHLLGAGRRSGDPTRREEGTSASSSSSSSTSGPPHAEGCQEVLYNQFSASRTRAYKAKRDGTTSNVARPEKSWSDMGATLLAESAAPLAQDPFASSSCATSTNNGGQRSGSSSSAASVSGQPVQPSSSSSSVADGTSTSPLPSAAVVSGTTTAKMVAKDHQKDEAWREHREQPNTIVGRTRTQLQEFEQEVSFELSPSPMVDSPPDEGLVLLDSTKSSKGGATKADMPQPNDYHVPMSIRNCDSMNMISTSKTSSNTSKQQGSSEQVQAVREQVQDCEQQMKRSSPPSLFGNRPARMRNAAAFSASASKSSPSPQQQEELLSLRRMLEEKESRLSELQKQILQPDEVRKLATLLEELKNRREETGKSPASVIR